jgi:hypothetical protein
MAINTLTQTFTLKSLSVEPSPGQIWTTGTTKTARKIGEQNLPADYILTEIQVDCKGITGASGADPCILRVYQYGRENAAATIEVSSVGISLQPINLIIAARYGADRKVIIDAWDADTSSPNNTCSIKGTIGVAGRPYFDTGGATVQTVAY